MNNKDNSVSVAVTECVGFIYCVSREGQKCVLPTIGEKRESEWVSEREKEIYRSFNDPVIKVSSQMFLGCFFFLLFWTRIFVQKKNFYIKWTSLHTKTQGSICFVTVHNNRYVWASVNRKTECQSRDNSGGWHCFAQIDEVFLFNTII